MNDAKPDQKLDLLDSYLEIEDLPGKRVTLKLLGDNLRNYPLAIALWTAVAFLWSESNPGALIAAVVWGLWLMWFSVLTAMQTFFLAAAVLMDLGERVIGKRMYTNKVLRRIFVLIAGNAALAMMGGSVFVSLALFRAIPQ